MDTDEELVAPRVFNENDLGVVLGAALLSPAFVLSWLFMGGIQGMAALLYALLLSGLIALILTFVRKVLLKTVPLNFVLVWYMFVLGYAVYYVFTK